MQPKRKTYSIKHKLEAVQLHIRNPPEDECQGRLGRESLIGFFNPAIPTKMFPSSRHPECFYRPIPIPVITSQSNPDPTFLYNPESRAFKGQIPVPENPIGDPLGHARKAWFINVDTPRVPKQNKPTKVHRDTTPNKQKT